ncbi:MAG: DUF4468 domain-containing protein [Tannerella sp.]|nr:DUF4468 domain-containing protein [Tannerella sp.]
MRKIIRCLVMVAACMPVLLFAQDDDSKYLAGAVPEVDGKVVFTKEFDLKGADRDAIYDRIYEWLDKRMKANENNSRISYTKKEEGQIVAQGEEYLVFSSNAFSLDRSMMSYNLVVLCKPGKCEMSIERIRYSYEDSRYTAEEQISDGMALNKKKTSIYRGNRRFRVKTVDYVDDLFENAGMALGLRDVAAIALPAQAQQTATVPPVATEPALSTEVTVQSVQAVEKPAPAPTIATPVPLPEEANVSAAPANITVTPASSSGKPVSLEGYKHLSPDKIPGNIIKMLNEDWMLITAGTDAKFNMMTASWGGLGVLYGKPVATCFINPTRYTYQLMETNETYTLTFYTEAYREALQYCGSNSGRDQDKVKGSGLTPVTTPSGSKAFSEAWLIIECRKLIGQSLSHDALFDEKVKNEWAGKQLHKMYIGEIINVWVK